jgi:hypothetical protein
LYQRFTNGGKLLIPSNCNNSEAMQEIHLVCCKEGFATICFCAVCKMSDRGEAYLCALGCEEDVFVDKETINSQFSIMLELDELSSNLDSTLCHALAILPHSVPFHLENRLAPNYLFGLDFLDGHFRPRDPPLHLQLLSNLPWKDISASHTSL